MWVEVGDQHSRLVDVYLVAKHPHYLRQITPGNKASLVDVQDAHDLAHGQFLLADGLTHQLQYIAHSILLVDAFLQLPNTLVKV